MLQTVVSLVVSLIAATPSSVPFEICSNKPFVPVTVDSSASQWFILDSGNNGHSIVSEECADRLGLGHGAADQVHIGAGAGQTAQLSQALRPVFLHALGETFTVTEPQILTLGHVARMEGRRVDGLIGADFLFGHVVELDYARHTIRLHDVDGYRPPPGATVLPLQLDTGWPVVDATVTTSNGASLRCQLIVDTGMRGTVTLFRPFSVRHALLDPTGGLRDVVLGGGAGGILRGDVARLTALRLAGLTFSRPVAAFSRDTTGIFALDGPDGIMGGELLRRHRVTFDYPHQRMILESGSDRPEPFEYDMSGLFLGAEAPDFTAIRVLAVNPDTPAACAGLEVGDLIVAIDGQRTPALNLDRTRSLLRSPGARRLEVRRGERVIALVLTARRLV